MVSAGALRADPGFRRYLAARAVSMAGTLITAVVLPVLIYRLTGSAAWTAAVVVVQALPYLFLAPVAGSIVGAQFSLCRSSEIAPMPRPPRRPR